MSAEPAAPLHVVPELPHELVRHWTVLAKDGTELRAWTNDVDGTMTGPTVLLCNGLGTNPYAWPALLRPDCGVRVISWYHRGTGGSARPPTRAHVGIDAFVEDALAVMDDAGIDACPVMGWSMGVNTAFELAYLHPQRVTGAVRGGGGARRHLRLDAGSAADPPRLRGLRSPSTSRGPWSVLGKPLSRWSRTRLPVGPRTVAVLSHSGFMLPGRRPRAGAAERSRSS